MSDWAHFFICFASPLRLLEAPAATMEKGDPNSDKDFGFFYPIDFDEASDINLDVSAWGGKSLRSLSFPDLTGMVGDADAFGHDNQTYGRQSSVANTTNHFNNSNTTNATDSNEFHGMPPLITKRVSMEVAVAPPPKRVAKAATAAKVSKYSCKANVKAGIGAKLQPVLQEKGHGFLHRVLCKPGVSAREVDSILRRFPRSASTSLVIGSHKKAYNPLTQQTELKMVNEPFTYPLHLAIYYGANREVLTMLIDAAPSVLEKKDGNVLQTPLHLLIKRFPRDAELVKRMILKKPQCIFSKDKHENTATHIACARGASREVIQCLTTLFPQSTKMPNFHGKIPSDLARYAL